MHAVIEITKGVEIIAILDVAMASGGGGFEETSRRFRIPPGFRGRAVTSLRVACRGSVVDRFYPA